MAMIRSNRAKQFMPFDALNGLKEALFLKEREFEKTQKLEKSEEQDQEISDTLQELSIGDIVTVICFENGYYITVTDKLNKIDLIYKTITVGDGKISFNNLYKITRGI